MQQVLGDLGGGSGQLFVYAVCGCETVKGFLGINMIELCKGTTPQTCGERLSASVVVSTQAAPFQVHDIARRRLSTKANAEEVQSEEGGSVDTAGLTSQFGGNSKFASVLAASLQRSGGADALTTGPERVDEP